MIATAASTYLSALDDEDQATAELYIQKAAQAVEEAWKQTIKGLQGPGVANPTIASLEHTSSASQDEDAAPRKSQLSAPQLQAQLFTVHRPDSTQAPEGHTLLQRSVTAGFEDRRLVPHRTGGVLTPHDYNLETGHGQDSASAHCAASSWTHRWNTEKPAVPPKPREDTTHAFTLWCVVQNSQTQASPRDPEGSQLCNPGRLIHCCPRAQCGPGCVCGFFPLQRQLAEMPHRRGISVFDRSGNMKS